MTDTTTTETAEATAVLPCQDVARALANAVIFTAAPKSPTIACVRMAFAEAENGGTLTLEATDSYVLYREVLSAGANNVSTGNAVVYVDKADVALVVKSLKIAKHGDVSLTVVGHTLTLTYFGMTLTVGSELSSPWPNTEQLRNGSPGDIGSIGFGAKVLARLSKITPAEGVRGPTGNALRFSFATTNLKPAVVTIGATIDLLVMPVRVDS